MIVQVIVLAMLFMMINVAMIYMGIVVRIMLLIIMRVTRLLVRMVLVILLAGAVWGVYVGSGGDSESVDSADSNIHVVYVVSGYYVDSDGGDGFDEYCEFWDCGDYDEYSGCGGSDEYDDGRYYYGRYYYDGRDYGAYVGCGGCVVYGNSFAYCNSDDCDGSYDDYDCHHKIVVIIAMLVDGTMLRASMSM